MTCRTSKIVLATFVNGNEICYLFVNSWLRHPRLRENWKTVTAAFLLFVAGVGMCTVYNATIEGLRATSS